MKFKIKVLQKYPHRTSNARDDLIRETELTLEEIIELVFGLIYGPDCEYRVETIE